VLALVAHSLLGCATPKNGAPPDGANRSGGIILEERFPDRARFRREDDGRWIAEWLAHRWKLSHDRAQLRRAIETELSKGYSIEESLLFTLPTVGLWTHAAYGTWEELMARVEMGVPAVVQLGFSSRKRRIRHFAIVTAAEDQSGGRAEVIFRDGVAVTLTKEAFLSRWSSFRNWMLIACPPDAARWPMRSAERVSLIRYFDLLGRVDTADDLADRALKRDPRNADLAAALGARALRLGRADEAERLLRAALRENDLHVRAANNLAYLLGERGENLDEALALANRALMLEPTNPRILHTYGTLLCKVGRCEEGRLSLERAWQRANMLPRDARVAIGFSLARAYLATGVPHLACEVIQNLRSADPSLMLPADLQGRLDLEGNCR
jgi:tetratricopeptide (TPR) repeat protein